jgi:hypothetical protein
MLPPPPPPRYPLWSMMMLSRFVLAWAVSQVVCYAVWDVSSRCFIVCVCFVRGVSDGHGCYEVFQVHKGGFAVVVCCGGFGSAVSPWPFRRHGRFGKFGSFRHGRFAMAVSSPWPFRHGRFVAMTVLADSDRFAMAVFSWQFRIVSPWQFFHGSFGSLRLGSFALAAFAVSFTLIRHGCFDLAVVVVSCRFSCVSSWLSFRVVSPLLSFRQLYRFRFLL